YHTPRNLLLALVGETGELSELFQGRPEAEAGPGLPGFSAGERLAVEEELADVLLYLAGMGPPGAVSRPRAISPISRNVDSTVAPTDSRALTTLATQPAARI
ncbi:hypothetical protein PLESTF_001849400, partial [Pleodorina starrii]